MYRDIKKTGLISAALNFLRTLPSRAAEFRPGISATLSISFSLVALLAVTANLVAEHGGWVVTIQEQAPVTAPIFSVARTSSLDGNRGSSPEHDASTLVTPIRLLSAIERFERITLLRAEADSSEIETERQAASNELRLAVSRFSREAQRASARLPAQLARSLEAYEGASETLVAAADERSAALSMFSSEFEQVNSRVKGAMDRAWKIFGRVVARQSLVNLSATLDKFRQHAVALTAPIPDQQSLNELHSSEDAFMALVEANRKSFTRTYGETWLSELQNDFQQIIVARQTIERLNLERDGIYEQLRLAKAEFIASVPVDLRVPTVDQHPTSADNRNVARLAPTDTLHGQLPNQSIAPGFGASSSVLLMADRWSFPSMMYNHVATSNQQVEVANSPQRELVAWMSGSILLILILVSVWTVRSVTVPVNRLVKAGRDLALGKRPAILERTGLKELDTLTEVFNRMSEEVVNARQNSIIYQQQLEAKVEERTIQLQYQAERDPLTLLPNRRQLFVMLNAAIDAAHQQSRYVGVMFVDIDNFKNINDSMGHNFGDHILVAIAERLSITAQPFGFAARLGGDEFMVVYASASREADIHLAGMNIVQAFQVPLLVEGRELRLSVSVGASIYPDHAQDVTGLLQCADAALYRAKALGRSQMSVFTAELLKLAADKFAIEQGLRRALDGGELELVFQPELSINTLRTELVEALIRWRLPDGQLLMPAQFLPVAEESGLIAEMGNWVMRSTIAAAARWHHGIWPEAKVAMNVSSRQLMNPLFVENLVGLMQEYRLPHRCIEIELTETVLQTGVGTIATLRQLQLHGIATALDDFGTGYSSLSSLEQLPLSRVKLDRSLIDSIHTNPRSAAIVRAIITLCQGLGVAVTAEGVELAEQFAFLSDYPDICVQGYLFSKPVSGHELPAVMEKISQVAQELVLMTPDTSASNIIEMPKEKRRIFRRSGKLV